MNWWLNLLQLYVLCWIALSLHKIQRHFGDPCIRDGHQWSLNFNHPDGDEYICDSCHDLKFVSW